MTIKYNYEFFVELCCLISGPPEKINEASESITFDEFEEVTAAAITGIKKRFFELSSSEQRIGFIKYLFEQIFSPSNCLLYGMAVSHMDEQERCEIAERIIEARIEEAGLIAGQQWATGVNDPFTVYKWDDLFLHEFVHEYIIKCDSMLGNFILEVSELCHEYQIAFDTMFKRLVTKAPAGSLDYDPDLLKYYTYMRSDGTYKGPYEDDEPISVVKKRRSGEAALDSCLDPFTSLFNDDYKIHADRFIDILKDLNLINEGHEWIGIRGASRVFFDCLKQKVIVSSDLTPAKVAEVFEKKFKNITVATFVNRPGAKAMDLKEEFIQEIEAAIKDIRLLK